MPNGEPKVSSKTRANDPRAVPAQTGARRWGPLWVAALFLICGCPLSFVIVSLIHVFQSARSAAIKSIALSDALQIDLAVLMYTNDWDDRYPPELSYLRTSGLIDPYLHHNQALFSVESGYTWNEELEGVDWSKVYDPSDTWLFRTTRYVQPDSYVVVAFVDGRAKSFTRPNLKVILDLDRNLTQLGADVHQVWRLPREGPT